MAGGVLPEEGTLRWLGGSCLRRGLSDGWGGLRCIFILTAGAGLHSDGHRSLPPVPGASVTLSELVHQIVEEGQGIILWPLLKAKHLFT